MSTGKGDVHKLVKESKEGGNPDDGYTAEETTHPQDRDSVSKAEGMNLEAPSTVGDRYKQASAFRIKALEKGLGK